MVLKFIKLSIDNKNVYPYIVFEFSMESSGFKVNMKRDGVVAVPFFL